MNRISATTLFALFVAVAAHSQTSKPPKTAPAKDAGLKIVATINGETLTREKFDFLWESLSPDMRSNYEMNGAGRIGYLDNYIERQLVVQQALKENFDKRKDIVPDLEEVRDKTLFDRYVRKQIAAEVVNEADLRAYYEANQKDFQKPERAKVRQIIVTPVFHTVVNTTDNDAPTPEEAKNKIRSLRSQLSKDSSLSAFADLASKYSEDLSAKSGGDLGWVAKGKLEDALNDALFNKLQPGQISDVLETKYGYHILFCEEKKPSGVAPFNEVREEVLEKLLKDRQAEILSVTKALTQDLRRVSSITIYRENL